jgi:hypothetical protein
MKSLRIPLAFTLGLCVLLVIFPGVRSTAQEKVGGKLKAEDVLKDWVFPKVEVQGPYWPRNDNAAGGYPDLANQGFAPKEPMEKVWKFYADKCGHKGQFPGQGAGIRDGTGNEKARYLMNFSGGNQRHKAYRCTFAYNTDRYTVFVELASGWEDQSTGVEVTVGTR